MSIASEKASKPIHKFRGSVDQQLITFDISSNHFAESSGNYGTRVLSVSTNETIGSTLSNYHRRVANGELLPHTQFRQHIAEGKAWGSQNRLETWVSYPWWRRNTINNFVASTANHVESPFQGDPNLVLPYYYISRGEAEAYADESYLSGLITEAQSNAYAQGHDTLTFLSELHKLRDMWKTRALKLLTLPSIAGNLTKGAKSAKGQVTKLAKNEPGNWLEWRYGWRTMLFDIKSLSDAIVDINDNRKRISQRAGFTHNDTNVYNYTETASEINSYIYQLREEIEISYRGSVTADFSPPRFQFNPIVTAWELLPYSFIIDWFLGVGAWLQSLSFMTLSRSWATSGGYQVRISRELDRRVLSWNTVAGVTFSGTRELFYDINSTTQVRIPQSASSLPPIRVRLDEWKVLDLLSILYQRIR